MIVCPLPATVGVRLHEPVPLTSVTVHDPPAPAIPTVPVGTPAEPLTVAVAVTGFETLVEFGMTLTLTDELNLLTVSVVVPLAALKLLDQVDLDDLPDSIRGHIAQIRQKAERLLDDETFELGGKSP